MDFSRMLSYTEALSKNNDRTWFHDNHREYELAQEDFLMVLDVMKFVLAKDAPAIGDMLLFENPKNFMYRIPRDMRYSKNKTPYNPAFRAYLSPHKKDFLPLSYYLHISCDRCIIETGAWPWDAKQLNRLREYIAYNYEELDSIVEQNSLMVYGEMLKRTPRGFDADHPAAEWLKYKFYLTEYSFTPDDLHDLDTFAEAAGRAVRRFEPLRQFLMGAFDDKVYSDEIDF